VKVNQATHPVGMMCRLLQVSRSGFYAWRDRPMCNRRREDLALTGLRGATLRKFVITTMRPEQAPQVADLVQRRFYAERPNRLWVADATYVPTWSGFLYLAIVLDVFSRKIVGWAMETHLRTELMLDINIGRDTPADAWLTVPSVRL
jgi:putative transposase